MEAIQSLKFKGRLELTLKKEDGSIERVLKDNLITSVGFDQIADALGAATGRPAVLGWVAVGSGVTAPASGNTALGTEITRVAASYSHTAGSLTFTISASFPAGVGTGAITEAGVLNAASAGTLFDRVTFSVVNKAAGDSLTAVFTFTMS